MMKTSFATSLHSLVFRTHTSSPSGTAHAMFMISKPLFHRPVSLQAIMLSSKQLKQFHSLSGFNGICSESTRVELQQLLLSRSYTSRSAPLSKASIKQKSDPSAGSRSKSLTESSADSGAVTLSLGEKVKENAKTGGYGIVILLGVAVTGAMLWFILSELFSSDSPNNIYTHAFKLCKLSTEVQDTLGTPIKCHGEETRRGWRRHVSHVEFFQGNTKYLRMRFYVEGPFNKGTVHLEKKKESTGKYEYSYLMVDVDGYPPRRIDVHF